VHRTLRDGATSTRPLMDTESGFLRLTTGVEFDAEHQSLA